MPSSTGITPRPPIVVLCGSTRFCEQFAEAALYETAAGRIVLAPGCNLREPHPLWATPAQAERIKHMLDNLHLRKIDLADDVLVINVNVRPSSPARTGASGARSSQKAARSAPAAADAAVVGQCGQRAELAGKLVPRQNLATAGRELLRVELGHGPGASAPVPQPQVPVTVDHSRRDRYGLGLIGGLPGDPARVGNAAQLGGGQPRGQVTGGLFGVLDRREPECVVKYGQGWILAAL